MISKSWPDYHRTIKYITLPAFVSLECLLILQFIAEMGGFDRRHAHVGSAVPHQGLRLPVIDISLRDFQ